MSRDRARALPLLLLAGAAWGAPPAWAGVRVSNPTVEVGDVRSGVQLTRIFHLLNDGSGEAEILEVRGSCGCLNPQVVPRLIPPHGTAKLKLSINTLGQGAGPHSWSARLTYRAEGKQADLAVSVRANVITEVTVQPAALTISARGSLIERVTLTDLRAQPLSITAVETSTPGLKARLLGQGRDAQGRWSGNIHLELTAELKPGRHVETLSIYTSDPAYQHLKVPVTIIRESGLKITAMPEQAVLRALPGESASCIVRLHGSGDEALRIATVDTGNPALTCKWAAGPGADVTLRIQLDPQQWSGKEFEASVQVRFESPLGDILRLPVGIGRP